MHKMLLVVPALLLAGAASAQTTTWQYGSGNGDPLPYAGPKPTYNYAIGPAADPGLPGVVPKTSYSYGGENQTGGMVQMGAPEPQQHATAPVRRPGDHS